MEILEAFKDYEHLILITAGVFAYFKWRDIERKTKSEAESEREEHKELVKEIIHSSLDNGIGLKMKSLIEEHEVRERANVREVMDHHTETWHRSRSRR